MPHSPGWTLGYFRIVFGNSVSNDILECVLTYDFTGLPATIANAHAAIDSADAVVTAGVIANINNFTFLQTYSLLLDDGTNQAVFAKLKQLQGTFGSTPLPQSVCAIWRKVASGMGRRRFGHLCWPGIDQDMLADANDLDAAPIAAMQGVASALNDAAVLFSVAGASHVLYHRDLDTRNAVGTFIPSKSLRNNRHRTPGRGI